MFAIFFAGLLRRSPIGEVDGRRMEGDPLGWVNLRGAHGAQVGDGNLQQNYHGPVTQVHGPAGALGLQKVQSAYLEQVRRIAPPDPPGLIGREEELAELAGFCLSAQGSSYAWWRADAWAGKSALLSSFVLRPPPEVGQRVKIVSFFITARLAAQDTREAFTEVLLEQLAALLEQPLPPVLPEATREAYLLGLVTQAAAACQDAGGRLVLVVDGLDEDQGVTTGPGAHSIAGLLPGDPPSGMRVIVAGRPNPPIPDDVPDWHPLRDPGIVRPLSDSIRASDVKRLGRQELQRLLHGTAAEMDLLGLLAAARGGLSARDLADLSAVPLWEVEDVLHTVAGRTFTRRPSSWSSWTRPDVYLLGHEELQAAAADYLGSSRLAAYRDRLHTWAETYRSRGWPPDSPEYLLTGYFRLLEGLSDLPRMIECARDLARHDRMLDLIGADTAALGEARTVLDLIGPQDVPDLSSALAIACHRDHLIGRNANIPAGLPAVWAALGQLPRAEALATSITSTGGQSRALLEVVAALLEKRQYTQAEATARSITGQSWRDQAWAEVALALARAGQSGQAETAARSMTGGRQQRGTLAAVAKIAAARVPARPRRQDADVAEQSEAAARSIATPSSRSAALARAAVTLARGGQHQRAAELAEEAAATTRRVSQPEDQVRALLRVVEVLTRGEQYRQAADVAEQATTVARSIPQGRLQGRVLADVGVAFTRAGKYREAEAAAQLVTDPSARAGALTDVAMALARADQYQQAAHVAVQAEAVARSIGYAGSRPDALAEAAIAVAEAGHSQEAVAAAGLISDPGSKSAALGDIAVALAQEGQPGKAQELALSLRHPYGQAVTLARVAAVLSQAGQNEEATHAAQQGEATTQSITTPVLRAGALAEVAAAFAGAGQREHAVRVARQAKAETRFITNLSRQVTALTRVAVSLTRAGQHAEALDALRQAEASSRSFADRDLQAGALARVARILAEAGQHQQANSAAQSITDPFRRSTALAQVAVLLAKAGQREPAANIAEQAETEAKSIAYASQRTRAQRDIAVALAVTGKYERAQFMARQITSFGPRHDATVEVATVLAQAGQYQVAEAMARTAFDEYLQGRVLARVAASLAEAGQHQAAEAMARTITDPSLRVGALADVTTALAKAGEARSAARFAAEICTLGGWLTAARPVLLLEPAAISTLAEVLKEQ